MTGGSDPIPTYHTNMTKLGENIIFKVLLWSLQWRYMSWRKFQVAEMTIYPLSFNKTNCDHLIYEHHDTQ